MKTVILCGGMGTRLSEETGLKPKPLVEVGPHPILWHIMQIFGRQGLNEFVLALGYKGDSIKEYFLNFFTLNSDFEVDLATGKVTHEASKNPNWKVSLVDTGTSTMTGGRLLRLKEKLQGTGTFMLTYGDGVANVDIKKLLEFHRSHKKLATVTAVRPYARFGGMTLGGAVDKGAKVDRFVEKPASGEGWINGGFFVFEPKIFDYIENDKTILERTVMEGLTRDGQLMAYQHEGYWQCMDTIRDKQLLEEQWATGKAPWLV